MFAAYLRLSAKAWEDLDYQLRHLEQSYLQMRDVPGFYLRRNGKPTDHQGLTDFWRCTWALSYAENREFEYEIKVVPPLPPESKSSLRQDVIDPTVSAGTDGIGSVPARTYYREDPKSSPNGLGTLIQVNPTLITMSALARRITTQSGVRIEVSPSIGDRQLFVSLNDVVLKDFLNTVVQLLGWTWRERISGKVQISRSAVRLPKAIHEIPDCLQTCIPPELLQFLGYRAYDLRVGNITDPDVKRRLQLFPPGPHRTRAAILSVGQDLRRTLEEQERKSLSRLVRPELYDGRQLPLKRLPPEYKRSLVNFLCLQAIIPLIDQTASFFSGDLQPIHVNLDQATIKALGDGGLGIEVQVRDSGAESKAGFGAQIDISIRDRFIPIAKP